MLVDDLFGRNGRGEGREEEKGLPFAASCFMKGFVGAAVSAAMVGCVYVLGFVGRRWVLLSDRARVIVGVGAENSQSCDDIIA